MPELTCHPFTRPDGTVFQICTLTGEGETRVTVIEDEPSVVAMEAGDDE